MAKFDGNKLIIHLEKKWQGKPCPMCGVGNWNVQDSSYELREYHGGNIVIGGGPIIPVVPVVCTNCGNTILVNAIIAGVVSRTEGTES